METHPSTYSGAWNYESLFAQHSMAAEFAGDSNNDSHQAETHFTTAQRLANPIELSTPIQASISLYKQ